MSEVGHAKNIQQFQSMISFVTAWGGAYKPSNSQIELANLVAALALADTAMDAVTSNLAVNKTSINDRQNVFKPLGPMVTRSVNYYESTGTADNFVDDAKSLKRKIDGKRASKKPVDDPNTPENEGDAAHSAAQTSYIQRVEHLDNLIAIYQGDALYSPNEADLAVSSLQTFSANMKSATQAVIDSYTNISNARLQRRTTMYSEPTSLYELQKLVKKYAKARFGASSPEFKQISKLKYTKYDD